MILQNPQLGGPTMISGRTGGDTNTTPNDSNSLLAGVSIVVPGVPYSPSRSGGSWRSIRECREVDRNAYRIFLIWDALLQGPEPTPLLVFVEIFPCTGNWYVKYQESKKSPNKQGRAREEPMVIMDWHESNSPIS